MLAGDTSNNSNYDIKMTIDEFTDTYSDDILYLREARLALLTHPLRNELPELCNASLCRIYAIIMIGSIEAMLERWRSRDNFRILDTYFAQGVSNEKRVNSLRDAFIENGINVQVDVFDDYLAIKYIRNAIVHASWETQNGNLKQDQLDWIVGRGFPSDTRKLTSEHWQRFEHINENMMFYIALTGLSGVQPRPDLTEVGVALRPLPDACGVILQADWPRIYWSNLERISSVIGKNIEKAAITPEFAWTRSFSDEQLNEMSDDEERIRRFYLSAKIAATQGFVDLQDNDCYAANALMCWDQFVSQVHEFKDLDEIAVEKALKSLRIIHTNNIHPKNHIFPPLRKDTPLSIREQLVKVCFERIEPLTTHEIAEAFALGEKAKYAIMNVTPLNLFAIQLPIIASGRNQEWQQKAQYIADVIEVGQSWYASLEGHPSPQPKIDFYRRMSTTLSKDS